MGLEVTDNEAEELVRRTKTLLDFLADAWDPSQGKSAEVLNKNLEEASRLSERWNKVRWVKHG